jgi:hypothetical protein
MLEPPDVGERMSGRAGGQHQDRDGIAGLPAAVQVELQSFPERLELIS